MAGSSEKLENPMMKNWLKKCWYIHRIEYIGAIKSHVI